MPLNLVNYSDSSSDNDDKEEEEEEYDKPKQQQQTKEQSGTKSKLPNPFEKPTQVEQNERDNASEHEGRVRLFPHERGNWATYVYIHCEKTESIATLQNELLNTMKSSKALEAVEFHPIDELHMSLTRTVVLQHHWIDEFVRGIENGLKNEQRFWIHLDSIKIYCNDNQSRTFISLSLAKHNPNANTNLQSIVKQLDNSLMDFKLPAFYKEASFHVSLLWCLGDKRDELQSLQPQFGNLLERLSAADDTHFTLNVERLFCKIGNKLFNFHL